MKNNVHIGKIILNLSNKISRQLNKDASTFGLTGVQARIIGFIHKNSNKRPLFQKDIEEELNIRRSSVTSALQLMEKKDYIKRISVCDDARLKKIVLTDKGLELDNKVYEAIHKMEQSLKDEFSDDEFNTLVNLIDRISKKIAD
ncbi:MarR family winged helix-turn-helix transcriptional regulator [Clostridium felsineum]|uniref:Transcriptional regulator SlyA n=1 Tax=Clostridium felsineum TaxID=36839 RepID=A0A1S8LHC9_9CLOT|nr:MarR family transcriptional regulator [Clostridium felsineum]MCR3757549.1 MarR family transcriptional regulator [Clostridium felsineum]URZ03126.1 Transcriptional regulator SlyA [Clostridium felsineum]URZ08528.1 Transcriptional regulator SlyA [Clostridium felsineum]URZ13559.1 Transcriptional regulator SlyA [Clostridium felsineum]URZ14478.1 Transcriptional regulator SlyA [Clostridium felsineum DSM 794]